MPKRILLVVSMSLLSIFSLQGARTENVHDRPYVVSLIRVIANPKTFDARRLRVVGYLDYNGIDRAIGVYVTEVDGRNFLISNSIDLRLQDSSEGKLIGKYVALEGTYHAPIGPFSDYANGYFDHLSEPKALEQGDVPKSGRLPR